MADELQHLLDRIQSDGVEKAQTESDLIIEQARAKASEIIDEAEKQAKSSLEEAEEGAQAFTRRAEQSLQQAARDTVLSVQSAIENTFKALLGAEVDKDVSGDLIKTLIETAVKAYAEKGASLDIMVPEAEQSSLAEWAAGAFRDAAGDGVEIKGDRTLAQGFRVSMADGRIQHDFSAEAITDALAALLRPQLAGILKAAQSND